MAKTRNQNHDASRRKNIKNCDASSRKRINNYDPFRRKRIIFFDKGGKAPWSDLDCDALYLIMMRLGVGDFFAFKGVCKSWRSVALSNMNMFMASRPPMSMDISMNISTTEFYYEKTCYLEDFDGRTFKTILPYSCHDKTCFGLTCGYLVFYGEKMDDFWLVNPITRHQLHFPDVPFDVNMCYIGGVRAILVFSPSISEWVLVVANRFGREIWSSTAGKGAWNHVSSSFQIFDFHVFNGKIYTLNYNEKAKNTFQLCEMRLNPRPKLMLLKTKNFPKSSFFPGFISLDGNLYAVHFNPIDCCGFHQLDFDEMKWFSHEKTIEEYAFFSSSKHLLQTCAFKLELLKNAGYDCTMKRFYTPNMWYSLHDCLNVNLIHD